MCLAGVNCQTSYATGSIVVAAAYNSTQCLVACQLHVYKLRSQEYIGT